MILIKGKASVVALLIFNAALLTAILSHLLFQASAARVQATAVPAPMPIIVDSTTAGNLNAEDVLCLAMNVYFEARGEPISGKLAVAEVTMNRLADRTKYHTVCDVVKKSKQFSWYKSRQVPTVVLYSRKGEVIEQNLTAWTESQMVAVTVLTMHTQDITRGATHFYNPDKSRPYWRTRFPVVAEIGNHIFLKAVLPSS